jgi:hypothetical protein
MPYVWHPTVSNGKFVIWHLDHFDPETGTDIWEVAGRADAIRTLIDEGYTVCGIYMPPDNAGDEGKVHSYPPPASAPYEVVADLHYFLETAIRVLNEYAGSFTAYYMAGHSGGGWTTMMLAALDTRITKSAPNAGSLPLCATNAVAMGRDWEQQLPTLINSVEYGDLYVMACSNGRYQTQFRNAYEGTPINGFNLAIYNLCPFKTDVETKSGGRCHLEWDMVTTVHEVTASTITKMIAFFNA